jgi:hypothetical protein
MDTTAKTTVGRRCNKEGLAVISSLGFSTSKKGYNYINTYIVLIAIITILIYFTLRGRAKDTSGFHATLGFVDLGRGNHFHGLCDFFNVLNRL